MSERTFGSSKSDQFSIQGKSKLQSGFNSDGSTIKFSIFEVVPESEKIGFMLATIRSEFVDHEPEATKRSEFSVFRVMIWSGCIVRPANIDGESADFHW